MSATPATNGAKVRITGMKRDDGLAAVLLVERVRAHQRIAVQEAQVHREHARPDVAPYRVVDRIAADGRHDQQRCRQHRVHVAGGAERAGDEQQRVAGQERQHHQPGLGKHDEKQHQVHPHAILFDPDA